MSTPNAGLPTMSANMLQPSVPYNAAMQIIDALMQLAIQDKDLTTPPSTVAGDAGKVWIVASGATSAWSGHDNELALCTGADLWLFIPPQPGWIGCVIDEGRALYAWSGSAWSPSAGSGTVSSVDVDADPSVGDVLDTTGGPVTSSGAVSVVAVDPGADRLIFWDDSESKLTYLQLGTNLSISGNVLNAAGGGGGGSADWGDIGGTLSDQSDLQAALNAKAGNAYSIVTEGSAFTADPGTHDGLGRYVRAGGNVTFDDAEPYTAGMAFNIRATASIELVGDGVTLTPPAGGTLDLDAGMAVQVIMTGATAGDVIGQTVASS